MYAGRSPRRHDDDFTLGDLGNAFLAEKERLIASGDLQPVTFDLYLRTIKRLLAFFGKRRLVTDIQPEEFSRLREDLAKTMGPKTLKEFISRTRSFFRFATVGGFVKQAIRFGPGFRAPSVKVLLHSRYAKGSMMFEADEILKLIAAANVHLRAIIHLGANCGFGPHDVGRLPTSAVDLGSGWCDYPRPKTGIFRRVPLWAETVAAIRESVEQRREPIKMADKGLLFVTARGQAWADQKPYSVVARQFRKLLKETDLYRPGRGFYGLRRGFETIAGESIDQVAVDHIMGHSRGDMASVYRQRISDERLVAVVNHVHGWLFPDRAGE